MNSKLIKREVPEGLKYGLEILLYRDDISPHIWERDETSQFIMHNYGKLYCSTDLSDKEWEEYLACAVCEVERLESSMPDTPIFPESSQNKNGFRRVAED